MTALQQLTTYTGYATNLRIPRQRDAVSGLPTPTRLESCPAWCAGHTSITPRMHRSHVLEAGTNGSAANRRPIRIIIEADQNADGTLGEPLIECDDRLLNVTNAAYLATVLGIAASACDPATAAATLDRPYGPYEAWQTMQGAYADALATVMHTPAIQTGEEFLAMALRLKAIWESLRLSDLQRETPIGQQLFHSMTAARANLEELSDLLNAIEDSSASLADIMNQPLQPDASARLDQLRAARRERDPEAARVKTELACEPWCDALNHGGLYGCEGYCMSDEDVLAVTGAGGRFENETFAMPCVEITSAIAYPEGSRTVHVIPRGPFAAHGTIEGWLELLPSEARRLAGLLHKHADQVDPAENQ